MDNESIWNRRFLLVCLSSFFVFMNFYTLATTLPVYVVEQLNGNQQQIGLTMTVFVIAAVICRPLAGRLVDTVGPKKIILFSLVLFLAGTLLYPFVNSMLFLLVLRLLHGSGFGMASTATGAIAADLVPDKRKGEGIGYFSMFMSLAMVIGPFAGLTVTSHFSFSVLFTMCGIFSLLALLCGLAANLPGKPAHTPDKTTVSENSRGWRSFIEIKAVPISLVGFVLAFAYSGITTFISVYADELSMKSTASYFFVCFALLIVLPRPLIGKLFDRFGENILVYPGIVLFTAGMLALSRAQDATLFLISGAIIGLGYGMLLPVFQTIAIKAAPAHRRGLATGTYFLIFDAGYGLGSYLLGIVAVHTHYHTVYFVSAIVVAFTSILYYVLHHSRQNKAANASPAAQAN
jgi:MFS family permease